MTFVLERDTTSPANAESPHHIAAYVTFHYVEKRLGYLIETVQALHNISIARKDIFIYVNDVDSAKINSIRVALGEAGIRDSVEIRICRDLEHPFLLTWAHKPDMRQAVLSSDNGYSHFIYVEDDEEITELQFAYFLEYLKPLKKNGLVPGFYRIERSDSSGVVMSTDQEKPIDLSARPHCTIGDRAFVDLTNPYMGCLLFDRELATEYVNSVAFSLVDSTLRRRWGPRERAAMGLTFENPPFPFIRRVVHPVDTRTRKPVPEACIRHLPNNYANQPDSPLGSIPIDEVFTGMLTKPSSARLLVRYAVARWMSGSRFMRVAVKNKFAPRNKVIKI